MDVAAQLRQSAAAYAARAQELLQQANNLQNQQQAAYRGFLEHGSVQTPVTAFQQASSYIGREEIEIIKAAVVQIRQEASTQVLGALSEVQALEDRVVRLESAVAGLAVAGVELGDAVVRTEIPAISAAPLEV